jgi:hypothetical protein
MNMMMIARWGIRMIAAGLLTSAWPLLGAPDDSVLLTPRPRQVEWTAAHFTIGPTGEISAVGEPVAQVARVLASELLRECGLRVTVGSSAEFKGRIVLALRQSAAGRTWLAGSPQAAAWSPAQNPEESYWLEVRDDAVGIIADTPRGLLYGCQTLLQIARAGKMAQGAVVRGVNIGDYPELGFRAVHICIFPTTELAAVRQAILLAARYKFNAVVLEPWASLISEKHPEFAYPHTYTAEQLRPLVDLGHALQMDMIPMVNSWGHAAGMRAQSGEQVVLDRFPNKSALFEKDGWSFNLSNPEIYDYLFGRYDEMLSLFGPSTRYFHVGMDEAWGHLGLNDSRETRGTDPVGLLVRHLNKIHEYFAQRNIRVIMWHDMFVQRAPTRGGNDKAIKTYLALDQLPKDVIIAAWDYGVDGTWPVPKYFQDKGFSVVVSPWKRKRNTVGLVDLAKQLNLFGVLATTWDSLDVSLPSIAQAGVLAWTAPGFDLKDIPFDHWLQELRLLPIERLPQLELTLDRAEPKKVRTQNKDRQPR